MMNILIILFTRFLVFDRVWCDFSSSLPVVHTTLGAVRGVLATDGDYTMYLGIPYAQVNRSNPFGVASAKKKYNGIYEAHEESSGCPQVDYSRKLIGNLECLDVNVYVPNSVHYKKCLPVLVWTYGGGFLNGNASKQRYGPRYLMKHDIIVVLFNYRSGPYGFMCLGTPDVPGNQGLKDQALALRWIKDNIRAFGGDDENMTLSGCSSGGSIVDYHLLYSKDKLFNKFILLSGASLSRWAVVDANVTVPFVIAEKLGFKTDNMSEALAFLTDQDELSVTQASFDADIVYGPCIEKTFEGFDAFITEHPVSAVPAIQNLSVLIGYTDDEQSYHIHRLNYGKSQTDFNEIIEEPLYFYFVNDGTQLLELETDVIRRFYYGDETEGDKIVRALLDFRSDHRICHPQERVTKKYLENGATVYRYFFKYVGGLNYIRSSWNVTEGGATHADDITYIFAKPQFYTRAPKPEDQRVVDVMTSFISDYVKYGDPTPSPTELLPVKWLPVTNDTLHYLRIDSTLSMGTRPFNRRMAFWDLMFMANEKLVRGKRIDL